MRIIKKYLKKDIYLQKKDRKLLMEYKKIINILDNTPNQPSKFKTKNCVEINDESHGVCNIGSQIRFKALMLRSNLCNYSDANYSSSRNKQHK